MKPVDLQISVRRSQEVGRTYYLKDKAPETALVDTAAGFKKALARRQSTVNHPEQANTSRLEDGRASERGETDRRRRRRRDSERDDKAQPEKQPGKGSMLDVTAGSE